MSRNIYTDWQVEVVLSAGKKFYRVFRVINPQEKDSNANREKRGGLYDKYADADRLRNVLNAEGANR